MSFTYEDVARNAVADVKAKGLDGSVSSLREVILNRISLYSDLLANNRDLLIKESVSPAYLEEYIEIAEGVLELTKEKETV